MRRLMYTAILVGTACPALAQDLTWTGYAELGYSIQRDEYSETIHWTDRTSNVAAYGEAKLGDCAVGAKVSGIYMTTSPSGYPPEWNAVGGGFRSYNIQGSGGCEYNGAWLFGIAGYQRDNGIKRYSVLDGDTYTLGGGAFYRGFERIGFGAAYLHNKYTYDSIYLDDANSNWITGKSEFFVTKNMLLSNVSSFNWQKGYTKLDFKTMVEYKLAEKPLSFYALAGAAHTDAGKHSHPPQRIFTVGLGLKFYFNQGTLEDTVKGSLPTF